MRKESRKTLCGVLLIACNFVCIISYFMPFAGFSSVVSLLGLKRENSVFDLADAFSKAAKTMDELNQYTAFYQSNTSTDYSGFVLYSIIIYIFAIMNIVLLAVGAWIIIKAMVDGKRYIEGANVGWVLNIIFYAIAIIVFLVIVNSDDAFKYIDASLAPWPIFSIVASIAGFKLCDIFNTITVDKPISSAPKPIPAEGYWQCRVCGTQNSNYITRCACGCLKDHSLPKPKESEAKTKETVIIPVINYSTECDLQVLEAIVNLTSGCVCMHFVNYKPEQKPKALKGNLELTSIFGEAIVSITGIAFLAIYEQKDKTYNTEYVDIALPKTNIKEIVSAKFKLTNIVLEDGTAIKVSDDYKPIPVSIERLKKLREKQADAVCEASNLDNGWQCSCGKRNSSENLVCKKCGRIIPAGKNNSDNPNAKMLNATDFMEFKTILIEEIKKGDTECEAIMDELWKKSTNSTFDELLAEGKKLIKSRIS